MIARKILLASVLLALGTAAAAKESKYHEVVNADSHDKFEQIVAMVQSELKPGGRYEFVPTAERTTIDNKLAEMLDLFKKNGSVEQMHQDEKVRLFNAQESVNAILTKRDSDRVICVNQAPIGSHIPKTSCHTYGQEEEARRQTAKTIKDWDNRGCAGASTEGPCMPGKAGAGHGK
jgi:hypothetical protein